MGRKVYLDARSKEQFDKVVAEYKEELEEEGLEYVYLNDVGQITEAGVEIWKCSEMDRQLKDYNVVYHLM